MALPRSNRPAVVPYLTCGWPTPECFLQAAEVAAEVGCPYFEVGFPFSDPIADGPVIQATSSEALAQGIDLESCFELTRDATARAGVPAVAMTYANLVFYHGVETFCRRLKEAGGEGLIVADLSFEESGSVREVCEAHDLDLISFLAPTSKRDRRRLIAEQARGFLYLVSVRGVTGGEVALSRELEALIADAKQAAECPVYVGFGVRGPEQVAALVGQGGADGVIVGTALLEAIRAETDRGESVRRAVQGFLEPMVEAAVRPLSV